ncbi:MAG TPA: decarboxylating NADP(+)-dependent phosphogluconate dehydrogenase [Kiritimatiellia bacterium]|nr:decarboxylating NADP(+)-dependent phosphogluconate dehydrogenase [Kiritimatiellia bacterium]
MSQADIGLIGLAVMGENLVLNMANHGYTVAVFNRSTDKVKAFLDGRAEGLPILGAYSYEELISKLKRPRRIMIMVKAGAPVDAVIEGLTPLLEPGDILIDGGNSYFPDTNRRTEALKESGILFIGTGVSGGEEGALKGPSIMPGGNRDAWPHVKSIFQDIAAKVPDGSPCCDWVGDNGAGHYVKMIHNGIEYGDMQMICEAYAVLKQAGGFSASELSKIFHEWNQGELDSYLIEITSEILAKQDDVSGNSMVDVILDTAGQKGTGKWTTQNALDLGIPLVTIAEATFARFMSALKDERVHASSILSGPAVSFKGDKKELVEHVRQALFASKICSYAQGFQLMKEAAKTYQWKLNFGSIAMMWRNGCIIRAQFLGNIKDAFDRNPDLPNLLLSPYFKEAIQRSQKGWRHVVSLAAESGIPVPAFAASLAYYDSYRSAVLPANLLQAQRDYFGAHTYERIDRPRGEFHHTNWTGEGGTTSSSTYNA